MASMRERGVEVFLVHDLLAETLEASERRASGSSNSVASSTRWACRRSTRSARPSKHEAGRSCQAPDRRPDRGREWPGPRRGGEVVVHRRRPRRPEHLRPAAAAEHLFTRDTSCWIYDGVSLNPMYWPARRKEASTSANLPVPSDVPRRRLRVLVSAGGRGRTSSPPRTSGWQRSRAAT